MKYQPYDYQQYATDTEDGSVAAIHPASAGHGLNLWRQGQQAETVTIHYIVTEGTIDEEILGALGCKDKTQESLIAAVKAQIPTKLKRRAG